MSDEKEINVVEVYKKQNTKKTYYGVYCLTKPDGKQELEDEWVDILISRRFEEGDPYNMDKATKALEIKLRKTHKQDTIEILKTFSDYKIAEEYQHKLNFKCPKQEPEDEE